MAAVLLAGYYAVFVPLDARIAQTTNKLGRETKLIALAANLERLQKQYSVLEPRVPRQTDTKEWVQYVLDGIRRLPLKMNQVRLPRAEAVRSAAGSSFFRSSWRGPSSTWTGFSAGWNRTSGCSGWTTSRSRRSQGGTGT